MLFDKPVGVVAKFEAFKRGLEPGESVERLDPQQLRVEGTDDTLGAAVAFRPTDASSGRLDAEDAKLSLDVLAHELVAVVGAQPETFGTVLRLRPEAARDGLAQRLGGLEAGGAYGSPKATVLGRAVIDEGEHVGGTVVTSEDRGEVDIDIISLGWVVVIVPSWVSAVCGTGARLGASRLSSRIRRNVLRLEVRTPAIRSRPPDLPMSKRQGGLRYTRRVGRRRTRNGHFW